MKLSERLDCDDPHLDILRRSHTGSKARGYTQGDRSPIAKHAISGQHDDVESLLHR